MTASTAPAARAAALTRLSALAALAAPLLAAAAAAAQTVTGAEARAMLFDPARVEVGVIGHPALDEAGRTILTQIAGQQRYYGAVAMAPDEGLMSEALVAAANFHDMPAARAAALAQCDARRSGGRACVVVMEIRPAGWTQRPVQLNTDATRAFEDTWRRAGGERALAISRSSGQWGIGTGAGATDAARAACAAMGPATDCAVVIRD